MNSSLTEFPAYHRLPGSLLRADAHTLEWSDGRQVLDLYGGHCVNTLGAAHPGLGQALNRQWQQLSFATNLVDHSTREAFLTAWRALLPDGDWQIFLSNSGAEANENILKMALSATGRSKVLCFQGAFHGRTAATAAVSDGQSGFPCSPFELERHPWGCIPDIDSSVAAVILEPIQSLAGVQEPPADFLQGLRQACDRHGAWLLFDEVQTGSGRLGQPWAAQYFEVMPDAWSTAKGCAGGLPLGMSLVSAAQASKVPAGLCGSTFGGSPLALAASTVVAEYLSHQKNLLHVRELGTAFHKLAQLEGVHSVRGAGALIGICFEDSITAREAQQALWQRQILTGLCRDPQVLRLCPALNLPLAAVHTLRTALEECVTSHQVGLS